MISSTGAVAGDLVFDASDAALFTRPANAFDQGFGGAPRCFGDPLRTHFTCGRSVCWFFGARSGGGGQRGIGHAAPRQQLPPNQVQVISQDTVTDISPIAFQPHIQAAVQAVML